MTRNKGQRPEGQAPTAAAFVAQLEARALGHGAVQHPVMALLTGGSPALRLSILAMLERCRRARLPALVDAHGDLAHALRQLGRVLPPLPALPPLCGEAHLSRALAAGAEETVWPVRLRALCRGDMARALGAMIFGEVVAELELQRRLSGAPARDEAASAIMRTLRDHAEAAAQDPAVRPAIERGAMLALSLREAALDELLAQVSPQHKAVLERA